MESAGKVKATSSQSKLKYMLGQAKQDPKLAAMLRDSEGQKGGSKKQPKNGKGRKEKKHRGLMRQTTTVVSQQTLSGTAAQGEKDEDPAPAQGEKAEDPAGPSTSPTPPQTKHQFMLTFKKDVDRTYEAARQKFEPDLSKLRAVCGSKLGKKAGHCAFEAVKLVVAELMAQTDREAKSLVTKHANQLIRNLQQKRKFCEQEWAARESQLTNSVRVLEEKLAETTKPLKGHETAGRWADDDELPTPQSASVEPPADAAEVAHESAESVHESAESVHESAEVVHESAAPAPAAAPPDVAEASSSGQERASHRAPGAEEPATIMHPARSTEPADAMRTASATEVRAAPSPAPLSPAGTARTEPLAGSETSGPALPTRTGAGSPAPGPSAAPAPPTGEDDYTRTLGENLFPQVEMHCPARASKVTGMLLELGIVEVCKMLSDTALLKSNIDECLRVLHHYETAAGCSPQVPPTGAHEQGPPLAPAARAPHAAPRTPQTAPPIPRVAPHTVTGTYPLAAAAPAERRPDRPPTPMTSPLPPASYCQHAAPTHNQPAPDYYQPTAPQPTAPDYYQPTAPTHHQPAPGYHQPAPGYHQPTAPGYYQPTAPGYYQPTAPGYYQPTVPDYYQPTAPDYYQPTATGYYQPVARSSTSASYHQQAAFAPQPDVRHYQAAPQVTTIRYVQQIGRFPQGQ
eukprot:TRINITY_DN18372_c0_g1_i4.p1 TRINITY_DN18372_c0_g1~~TRINITY_DN18372_c0_g1_i4.p1  ORF type:complete len:686 (+),score=174.75 TRINITY_DN18372_c0_g1_i4:106-2163(+)